ncbi:unnamed protein product [Ranitomeya imitator]|uniref:Protein kinase domain-containing protein n=1 Tax=Ranitomeya imitator TaxID=111125 RepID=A0ABN9LU07_9NEOB|nr:unnamed protein product [Ranitomeya imitator]
MVFYPCEVGNSTMKSMEMDPHGREGTSVHAAVRSKPRAFLPAAGSRRLGVLPPRLAWCSIDWEQVRVLEPLGSGGFGSVYRATLRPNGGAEEGEALQNRLASRQSFWGELNAACLRHPHVVRVVAASACCPGEPGSPGTIIMEYAGSSTSLRPTSAASLQLAGGCCC